MNRILRFLMVAIVAMISSANIHATKVYADLTASTAGGNATWDAATKTLSWTQSYANMMTLANLPSGDLTAYSSLILETDGYVDGNAYRLIVYYGDGSKNVVKPFYSSGIKEVNLHEMLTADQLKTVTKFCVAGASAAGTIKINKAYLVKPFALSFDSNGKAVISVTDLTATGSLSLDSETGILTCNGEGEGTLSVDLPVEGVDLSAVTGFVINKTGDGDILNNFVISNVDNSFSKAFYSNVYGRSDLGNHLSPATKVNKWTWYAKANAGTIKISTIEISGNVIRASAPSLTPLSLDMFHQWSGVEATATVTDNNGGGENNIGKAMGQGALIYGNGSVLSKHYADLTGYEKMIIKTTPGATVRILLNRVADGGSLVELTPVADTEGKIEVDLTSYEFVHVNAIKLPWNGMTVTVSSINLYKPTTNSADYVLTGSGAISDEVKMALADVNATCFDARLLTHPVTLPLANPNAVIYANEGIVTNENNVIVNGSCTSLKLIEGYSFAAPEDFTAAQASFTTNISEAGCATVLVPFDVVNLPGNCKIYGLNALNGTKIEVDETDRIMADKPVVIAGKVGENVLTATNAVVRKNTDILTNGLLTGAYHAVEAPVGAYVLQKHDDATGFYRLESVKQINPFRAYLTATSGAKALLLDLNDTLTAISQQAVNNRTVVSQYNLAGQRVANDKGVIINKMSDGRVFKTIK